MTTRVAIVGGSGYTGAELLRLLLCHPQVTIEMVCAGRSAGQKLGDVFPQFRDVLDIELVAFEAKAVAEAADVVFTALPHGQSAVTVAQLRDVGVPVLDLSADFRLRDSDEYARWYGEGAPHPRPELLEKAVYGLPELYREEIRGAELVACPGCYPTASILALAPALKARLVAGNGVIVDAKSGVSGAGRNSTQATHFAEIGEGIRAYKVAGLHRHTAEMTQEMSRLAGSDVTVTFSPHLLPMSRGILSTVYARMSAQDRGGEVSQVYRDFFAEEPFVSFAERLPDTAHVRGSNRVHVAARYDEATQMLVAFAAIDNLAKGASAQAVQCFNLMRGYPENTALGHVAMFP